MYKRILAFIQCWLHHRRLEVLNVTFWLFRLSPMYRSPRRDSLSPLLATDTRDFLQNVQIGCRVRNKATAVGADHPPKWRAQVNIETSYDYIPSTCLHGTHSNSHIPWTQATLRQRLPTATRQNFDRGQRCCHTGLRIYWQTTINLNGIKRCSS